MAEAAAQLDLQMLSENREMGILTPRKKQTSFYNRDPERYFFVIMVLSLLILLVRWVLNVFAPLSAIIIIFLVSASYYRREKIKGIYRISPEGIQVPYTWFSRRQIPLDDVIKVIDDTITQENTGREFTGVRILLDTKLLKYNITGTQSPNILLTTEEYNAHDINVFAEEVIRLKRQTTSTPNTLAQRVEDQVNRAWEGKWKLILLNVFDSTTEFLIYILVLEALIYGITGFSILMNLGLILFVGYLLFVFLFQFMNKPQAIIAIRPKEIGGPLIYDEAEIISTVRFIVMCRPYTVHLLHCEMIYTEEATKQVGRMQQIQPPFVEPGEITYAVAQMIGNHTKASGAKIQFTYKEKEDISDIVYELPIIWA